MLLKELIAGLPVRPAGCVIGGIPGMQADDLRRLPGADETAFYDGVIDVMDRLNRQYEQAGEKLSELDSPQLRAAFDRAPECQ